MSPRKLFEQELEEPVSYTHLDEEKSAGAVENIVAIDGIAVAVDPMNTVTDLTKDQLISIYTGEVKNWSDLGGRCV